MGEIVSEDHVVQELVRSVEDIPIGIADVLTVLQQLCSEHDPKDMSAVLHHAQTYALDDLPRLRRLVRLSMRPFEAACHYPLANFPAVMQGTITATAAATRPAPSLFYLNVRSPFSRVWLLSPQTCVAARLSEIQLAASFPKDEKEVVAIRAAHRRAGNQKARHLAATHRAGAVRAAGGAGAGATGAGGAGAGAAGAGEGAGAAAAGTWGPGLVAGAE
ncbi:unnamed protein product [Closterium sp. Naga37s-1]|nr:unnamed protein product [Closterium sp. Naga37s-1]